MITFHYVRRHCITGREFPDTLEARDRLQFLETLNRWNSQGRGVWQYFEA